MSDTAIKHFSDTQAETSDADHILAGYMTPEELAAELDMAVITLATWRMRQKGPPYSVVGRRIFYSRTGVKEWIASQVRKPLPPTRRGGRGQ